MRHSPAGLLAWSSFALWNVACGRSELSAFDSTAVDASAGDSAIKDAAPVDTKSDADASVCTPGEQLDCYSGPSSTRNIGACSPGVSECASDGSGYGACAGEVLPLLEACATPLDDDCDGLVNEECECEHVPSPENCALPGDEDCDGTVAPACGILEWTATLQPALSPKLIGLPNEDVILAEDTQQLSINLGGQSLGGGPDFDLYVARWSASGNHVWSQRSTGSGNEWLLDTAGNGDGAVLVGACSGDLSLSGFSTTCASDGDGFVLALDASGSVAWGRTLTGAFSQVAHAVDVDAAGNIFVAGMFMDQLQIGSAGIMNYGKHIFLCKISPLGTLLWISSYPFTPEGSAEPNLSLRVVASGPHPFLVGTMGKGYIDFQGKTFQGLGYGRLFVTSLDTSGNVQWVKASDQLPGNPMLMYLRAATRNPVDSSLWMGGEIYGGFAFSGGPAHQSLSGNPSGFALRLADDGTETWGAILPIASVFAASAGPTGVAVGGYLTNNGDVGHGPIATSSGSNFGYVLKQDANDIATWSRVLSTTSPNWSQTWGIVLHPSGAVAATGSFGQTIDPGGLLVTSPSPATFLVRYSP
jgi:hypothetical protein